MAWEVIYSHWQMVESAMPGRTQPYSSVKTATEGQDGVEELYIRGDGFLEIRMEDWDANTYYIPLGQVLAYYSVDDTNVGEES